MLAADLVDQEDVGRVGHADDERLAVLSFEPIAGAPSACGCSRAAGGERLCVDLVLLRRDRIRDSASRPAPRGSAPRSPPLIVSRIWASDLPGVWAWTLRACVRCSSLICPRSSSNCSTLCRCFVCAGCQSDWRSGRSSCSTTSATEAVLFLRPNTSASLLAHLQGKAVVVAANDDGVGVDLLDQASINLLPFAIHSAVDHAGSVLAADERLEL